MEKLLEILEDLVPGVDYGSCKTLIDEQILTSFDVLSLISDIEDTFDVEISTGDITPDNFNSAENIWNLIQKTKES